MGIGAALGQSVGRSIGAALGSPEVETHDANFPITLLGPKLIAWWSPRDRSSVWQNTAGTTAITADGQEIQRIDDKSGNGYHLTKNGGGAACIAGTGYGVSQKCAILWTTGGGSNFVAANSLQHNATNRNYFFAFNDRGLGYDSYWYYDQTGTPKFFIQQNSEYGDPYTYQDDGIAPSAKRFDNVRTPGFRSVCRWRFDSTLIRVENAFMGETKADTWPSVDIAMDGQFFRTCYSDLFDWIITDGTITSDEAAQLEEWMRARINEPTTFNPTTNLILFGDSLTTGIGSETYRSWPRMLFTSIGYEPRWAGIVGPFNKLISLDTMTPWIDGTRNNVGVWWLGTNDIYVFGRTAAQVQTDLETSINAFFAGGGDEAYVLTMIKRDTATGANETKRQDYNASIAARAATVGYTVIDVAADAAFDDPSDTTYYADLIHLTDAGYTIIAGYVETALGL